MPKSFFAARLRSLIDAAGGLSIPELAARSGLSRQHVHAMLEGVNTRPSFDTVCKLAEALGVSVEAFQQT